MKIRVGMGFDVHRLVEGRELWLGGIRIDHTLGLLGHSDADVVIHALCDALLGAAALRDIGFHFPDTAVEYKNIDSKILLRDTVTLIRDKGYEIGNADITICAERPKLNPHIPAMQECLSRIMGVEVEDVSIKDIFIKMNKRITVLFDREHTLGHAYFLPLKDAPTIETLANIFENSIIPLLQEYFYEDYEKIRLVLGDNQKDTEDKQFITIEENDYNDLFGDTDYEFDEMRTYKINSFALTNIEAYRSI